MNHFETLADSLAAEKFDTDLKTLQPAEDRNFLNPRLSISTRFLSRFQDRIRAWSSQAPPPQISEESSLQSPVRSDGASTPPHGENTSSYVTTKALSTQNSEAPAAQQAPDRQGYMGTTASFRAKASQDLLTSTQGEKENLPTSSSEAPPLPSVSVGQGNHSARAALYLDLASSSTVPSQKVQQCVSMMSPCRPALVTPTEMRSLGREGRRSISSIEERLTARGRVLSPAPSTIATCSSTSSSTAASVITSTGSITSSSSVTSPSSSESRQAGGAGGAERRVEAVPVSEPSLEAQQCSSAPPTPLSSLSDKPRPPQPGCVGEGVSVQQCHQVANELRHTMRRAVQLYQQVSVMSGSPEQQLLMSSVLQEAFGGVRTDLNSVLAERSGGAPCGQLTDDRTLALLEKYSDMLLRITRSKLERL